MPSLAMFAFSLQTVATGLTAPMQYVANPADTTLAYVAERRGVIRLLVDDALQTAPVMNIQTRVTMSGEGGLLGMCLDPNFATNRYFYLHFSNTATLNTQVSRFQMAADFRSAAPASEQSVLYWNQSPYTNHKSGTIEFGPDGMLYVGLGDGGSGNDPLNRAQDMSTLFGKVLRIDPSGDDFPADSAQNYRIPASNPFASGWPSTVRREIWHLGVRNPFRWHFDPVTGSMILADVGQNANEEINFLLPNEAGKNLGWRMKEADRWTGMKGRGFGRDAAVKPATRPSVDPFVIMPRASGASVIGGYIYRGANLPGRSGQYFFGDYVGNRLWACPMSYDASGRAIPVPWASCELLLSGFSGLVSIDTDKDGELMMTELNAGRVRRLIWIP